MKGPMKSQRPGEQCKTTRPPRAQTLCLMGIMRRRRSHSPSAPSALRAGKPGKMREWQIRDGLSSRGRPRRCQRRRCRRGRTGMRTTRPGTRTMRGHSPGAGAYSSLVFLSPHLSRLDGTGYLNARAGSAEGANNERHSRERREARTVFDGAGS